MRFTQLKIHAKDPDRLARFYVMALDCSVALPLTTLEEPVSRGVGSDGAKVDILVLRLPGPEDGPTLELISVGDVHDFGKGLLTFYVEDVAAAAERVVEAGGDYKGEIVDIKGPSGNVSRFVFMTDPEGNVIDLLTRVG